MHCLPALRRDFLPLIHRCWIKDSGVQYGSVVAYLIVVLLFNSTIFVIVITTMLKLRSVTSPQGKRQSRNITCSVLGLTCILGLTWGMGFFSMGYTNYVILYIFNSLKGKLSSLSERANGILYFLFFLSIRVRKQASNIGVKDIPYIQSK